MSRRDLTEHVDRIVRHAGREQDVAELHLDLGLADLSATRVR